MSDQGLLARGRPAPWAPAGGKETCSRGVSGTPTLANSNYEGPGIGALVPRENPPGNQELDAGTRTLNALLRDLPGCGERGLALLTQR